MNGPSSPPGAAPVDRSAAVRDHLANERTLLAWMRTALTVVGLGFVVDRLSLEAGGGSTGGAGILGVVLVALGAVLAAAGGYRFVRTEREIDTGTFRSALTLDLVLVGLIVLGAIALAGYLLLAPR